MPIPQEALVYPSESFWINIDAKQLLVDPTWEAYIANSDLNQILKKKHYTLDDVTLNNKLRLKVTQSYDRNRKPETALSLILPPGPLTINTHFNDQEIHPAGVHLYEEDHVTKIGKFYRNINHAKELAILLSWELGEIIKAKNKAVKEQKYEESSNLRDREKKLSNELDQKYENIYFESLQQLK